MALGATSKVDSIILAGVMQMMKCSNAHVETAQMSLPVWLGGLGVPLMLIRTVLLVHAAFLAAAALTRRAVSAGSLILSKVLL